MVKQWVYTNNQLEKYSLKVSSMKAGYYVLKMEIDGEVVTIKVMIQ